MDTATLFYTIVSVVGGIMLAVIGFFLKRTITLVDQVQKQQEKQNETKADCKDLNTLRSDMKERIEKLSDDIEGIKEDYITKEDFFREQAKTDRKLDMILDILLKWKGGKSDNG